MTVEQRANDFAEVYAITSRYNGEVVDRKHLSNAVKESIRAAINCDRRDRPEFKVAIEEDRAEVVSIVEAERVRLSELAEVYRRSPGCALDAAQCAFAASICEMIEGAIRACSEGGGP